MSMYKGPRNLEEVVGWSIVSSGPARWEWPIQTESLSRSHVESDAPAEETAWRRRQGCISGLKTAKAVGQESAWSEKPLGVGGGGAGEGCEANSVFHSEILKKKIWPHFHTLHQLPHLWVFYFFFSIIFSWWIIGRKGSNEHVPLIIKGPNKASSQFHGQGLSKQEVGEGIEERWCFRLFMLF